VQVVQECSKKEVRGQISPFTFALGAHGYNDIIVMTIAESNNTNFGIEFYRTLSLQAACLKKLS